MRSLFRPLSAIVVMTALALVAGLTPASPLDVASDLLSVISPDTPTAAPTKAAPPVKLSAPPVKKKAVAKAKRAAKRTKTSPKPPPRRTSRYGLAWPLPNGRLTGGFGRRGLGYHHGLDLACWEGQPMYPAAGGRIAYSGVMWPYGNTVIVQNSRRVRTLYAHLSVRYGKVGKRITRDSMIGRCGSTGVSTGPHLHFEVYYNSRVRNPIGFLPRRGR